ncbi:MAG: gamma-glutamylcyclotransferase family protein [Chitinispirillaceae bacterium]
MYGTLLDPAVQQNVIGRKVNGKRAVLQGFLKTERQFSEGIYPDLIRKGEGTVEGILLDLTAEELRRCDDYEGNEYRRVLLDTLESGKAWVYMGRRE